MKILMVNYEFPPILGGAARATRYISKELALCGNDVTVVTSRVKDTLDFEVLDGVKVFRLPAFIKNKDRTALLEMVKFLVLAVRKVNSLYRKEKYDLIHYFFSIPSGLVSFFVNRKYPFIVSLRGSDVPGYDRAAFSILHRLLKPVNISIWKRAKKVVALSEGLKRIALLSAPQLKFDVIYNGVDGLLFQSCNDRKDRDGKIIKLICVSRLIERKGIQHLLQAISRMDYHKPQIELLIVGGGIFEKRLKQQAEQLGLNKTVSFYGECAYENLPKLYSDADIFVLPSLTESFGMVFVEAMACGLPIIATRIGGIPEVVADGKNGILVDSGDIEGLKKALVVMATNKELRFKMGAESIRRSRELFSWKNIANNYQDIYRRVLD